MHPPLKEFYLLPTTEATENKVEGILKQLKAGVESIQQSEKFRLFLFTMAKFHDYNIGNMILIMLHKTNATHVAGFNTWKELDRWVKGYCHFSSGLFLIRYLSEMRG
jgi:hypothetical protein